MTVAFISGIVLLAIGLFLIVIGWPDRSGESPRFLRFPAAPMLYPPVIMAVLVAGIAQLFTLFF